MIIELITKIFNFEELFTFFSFLSFFVYRLFHTNELRQDLNLEGLQNYYENF